MNAALILALLMASGDESRYWSVDYLSPPKGEVLEVGGMGFLPDGDLVVSTRRGQVWRISDPLAENPDDASFELICEGLNEGLGLAVVNGEIVVLQRTELSRLLDKNDDRIIDTIETISQDWGASGNYHEFAFGLPIDADGNMYIGLNVGFWGAQWWHGKSRVPWRGWVLKVAPNGTTTPVAPGFRSPCGLGMMDDGTLLVTDNQGDWMPAGPIYAVQPGGFHGHPASLRWSDQWPNNLDEASDTVPPDTPRVPAAIWLPYKWSRSAGNLIADTTGGAFGPFEGQFLVAELTNGQIIRADFEEIDGTLQGACWQLRQRVGSAARVAFAPDGTLMVGMTNRGWGGLPPSDGIARVRWTGELPMEMERVHILQDGFEVSFTKPLGGVPKVTAERYDYDWWWEYGSPERNTTPMPLAGSSLSEDGLTMTIRLEGMAAGTCARVVLHEAMAVDGTPLLHDEFNYTINRIPGDAEGAIVPVAKKARPPVERGQRVEGWLYLMWGDSFELWDHENIAVGNAELDIDQPTRFAMPPGGNWLVAEEVSAFDSRLRFEADAEILIRFMLPEQGRGVFWLRPDIGIQVADSASQPPGTMIDGDGRVLFLPRQSGYLGPGLAHEMKIWLNNDRIERIEVNAVPVVENMPLPERAESDLSLGVECLDGQMAFADIRLRRPEIPEGAGEWHSLLQQADTWRAIGDIEWDLTDQTLSLKGDGVLLIPQPLQHAGAVRLDVWTDGTGYGGIILQPDDTGTGTTVDVGTTKGRGMGGVRGRRSLQVTPIGSHEWCTLELVPGSPGRVNLNGVSLIDTEDLPLPGNWIGIEVRNGAAIRVRHFTVSDNGVLAVAPD